MKKTLQITIFLAIGFLFSPAKVLAQWNQPQWVIDQYEPHVYNFVYNSANASLAYRLLRPINYNSNQLYPVVITLHGYTGFNKVTASDYNINNLRYINQEFAKDSIRLAHPTYVVCLQGIKNADGTVDMWNRKYLNGVKQIIAALPNVDSNKIYVLGQSAGGFGTNKFISYDPSYFAAAISVSAQGGNDLDLVDREALINFNLWTMHGDTDTTMNYSSDVELFNYMQSRNAKMKFTTFLNMGHSTEFYLVGSYTNAGVKRTLIADTATGTTILRVFNYTTQYAGSSSDPEPNTLDWLFSKSLNGTLDVNENEQDLNVYPNPTHSEISWNYSSNVDEIVVVNVIGKIVLRVTMPATNSIDLSNLESGIYFLKIQKNNSVITKKIVKK